VGLESWGREVYSGDECSGGRGSGGNEAEGEWFHVLCRTVLNIARFTPKVKRVNRPKRYG